MSATPDALVEECCDDLRLALRSVLKQRLDWAALPERERNKLEAEMARVDRLKINSSVERVIAAIVMHARIEGVKTKEDAV